MKAFLRAACFALCLPGLAHAADPGFTPAQRQEIVKILREALKTDPTILRDAVMAMQLSDQQAKTDESQKAIAANKQTLFNNPADPVVGNPKGDVTLVEFYDPRCPYCKKVLPEIAALLEKDQKLRLVYKDVPVLGPDSNLEVKAILAAARQGGYAKMQHAVMTDPGKPTELSLRDLATHLGLDGDRLVRDMNGADVAAQIKANLTLARAMKVTGTPTFVVADTVIPGAVDAADLTDIIGEVRKQKAN